MPKDARYSRKLRAGRAGACVARWTVLSDAREWVLGLVSFIYKQVSEWRTLLARLRRARLLAGEDPLQPGQLDAHPLVREYFGAQLRSQWAAAWQEGNRRLYEHYRALAPEMPDALRAMEPLFLAVICGCQADRFRDALAA